MTSFLAAVVLLSGLHLSSASPVFGRDSGCCFHLSANGGPGGDVGQLSDGQNRIGQSNLPTPKAQYCLDSNGGLTDSTGRGCILTPPTTQWQCDVGATPNSSFSIGCDGSLLNQGKSNFWACDTGDNNGYNIYSQPLQGEPSCTEITLTADNDNCKSGCAPAPSPTPPAPAPTCPGTLPSGFEYPHLILPVDSSSPNKAFPNSYNGTACGGTSSLFNFDIPPSDAGKTCKLSFFLPNWSQLETSTYWLSGSGNVKFSKLVGSASEGMTYSSMPKVDVDYGVSKLSPGTAITVASFDCPGNTRIGVEMAAADDTCFSYFQDYNPCPIGMYITSS